MALSMDEQRILDQIERGLASSDPLLASRMASFGAPRSPLTARMRRIRLLASFEHRYWWSRWCRSWSTRWSRSARPGDRSGSSKASSARRRIRR